jgi:hypothetical protein
MLAQKLAAATNAADQSMDVGWLWQWIACMALSSCVTDAASRRTSVVRLDAQIAPLPAPVCEAAHT